MTHEQSAKSNGVCIATVPNTARQYFAEGLAFVLVLKRNVNSDNAKRKLDRRADARIIEIACSPAPESHSQWTLRLLVEECKVKFDTPVSNDTIGRALKNCLRSHKNDYQCIPSKEDAEFIACMEDILDIYELPYNPNVPVVCMDEKLYQLLGDARKPFPMRPGDKQKIDSEYIYNGTCSMGD